MQDLSGHETDLSADAKPSVVAIVGPTCTGKTALSLALAERLGAEIIACDSRTIYREMNIGTAKPSTKERLRIAHHMIDVADPNEVFTVAQYRDQGRQAVAAILGRGRLPMVVGGTGFYCRALIEGLEIPPVAPEHDLRAQLRQIADRQGSAALHKQLEELDPATAARLNVNDLFRIVRALEVSIILGRPFSELARISEPPYRTVWIGLMLKDRSKLAQAIRNRFHEQMDQGMLGELEYLLGRYGPCRSIINTVNYKQLALYLQSQLTLAQAEEEAVKHNYQLARRQLMWFRANKEIAWFAVDEIGREDLCERVAALIDTRLAHSR